MRRIRFHDFYIKAMFQSTNQVHVFLQHEAVGHIKHTVDGRNPAPPWMVETL